MTDATQNPERDNDHLDTQPQDGSEQREPLDKQPIEPTNEETPAPATGGRGAAGAGGPDGFGTGS